MNIHRLVWPMHLFFVWLVRQNAHHRVENDDTLPPRLPVKRDDGIHAVASRHEHLRMKQQRHSAIRELLVTASVLSQDELRKKLAKRGFTVTQATLSRDIHELRVYKGPNGYALPGGADDDEDGPGVRQTLESYGLEVKQAQNLVVVITRTGGAQPVAATLDYEDWPEIVGTIAGDDTVLVICPDEKKATMLRTRMEELIG
jgi:transcriptional regulator of arginine metabolism